MTPRLFSRLIVYGKRRAFQNLVPAFRLHQRSHHGEPALPVSGRETIQVRGLARVLLDAQQFASSILCFVVMAFERVGGREVMNVVAVMATSIKLVRFHVPALKLG